MAATLGHFSAPVREWFERAFGEPTPPQVEGWPPIARGESTLICAPTGSGKTLAAFLWAIDRLIRDSSRPGPDRRLADGRTHVLYVSPLKALGYDIERNLRVPLSAIPGAEEITFGIRTGDTSQKERAALLRHPPDILITTPESLYLMLTSRARDARGGGVRDRGRDPCGRGEQARIPSDAYPGKTRRAGEVVPPGSSPTCWGRGRCGCRSRSGSRSSVTQCS